MPSQLATPRPVHRVTIGGLERDLPIHEVAPGVRIAVFDMLGDVEVVEAVAAALEPAVPQDAHVLVTAEAKAIPLVHALGRRCARPAVVLRKERKPYMGATIEAATNSITTGRAQTLFLGERDVVALKDRRVVLVDDVVSTGSTLAAMRQIVAKAGGRVVAVVAVFTEGDAEAGGDLVALGHLPVFGTTA